MTRQGHGGALGSRDRGIAYILKADHGLDLPRPLQIEFSKIAQEQMDPGLFNALSERDVADSAVRDVFSLSEGKPV